MKFTTKGKPVLLVILYFYILYLDEIILLFGTSSNIIVATRGSNQNCKRCNKPWKKNKLRGGGRIFTFQNKEEKNDGKSFVLEHDVKNIKMKAYLSALIQNMKDLNILEKKDGIDEDPGAPTKVHPRIDDII